VLFGKNISSHHAGIFVWVRIAIKPGKSYLGCQWGGPPCPPLIYGPQDSPVGSKS